MTDLGSANGTTLDGVPVEGPTRRAPAPWSHRRHRIEIGGGVAPNRTDPDPAHARSRGHRIRRSTSVASSVARVSAREILGVHDEPGRSRSCSATSSRRRRWPSRRRPRRGSRCCSATTRSSRARRRARGRIVKHQGDGYMLCFRSARTRCSAAIGIQRDLARTASGARPAELRVRMGCTPVRCSSTTTAISSASTSSSPHASARSPRAARSSSRRSCARSPSPGRHPFVEPRDVELQGITDVETVWSRRLACGVRACGPGRRCRVAGHAGPPTLVPVAVVPRGCSWAAGRRQRRRRAAATRRDDHVPTGRSRTRARSTDARSRSPTCRSRAPSCASRGRRTTRPTSRRTTSTCTGTSTPPIRSATTPPSRGVVQGEWVPTADYPGPTSPAASCRPPGAGSRRRSASPRVTAITT